MSELKLSPSEALYGFAGWLTTRGARTVMSSSDDASPIADLVAEFCRENELEPPRDRWPILLKHPAEKPADAQPLVANEPVPQGECQTQARDPVTELRAQLLHTATKLAIGRDPNAIGFVDAYLRLEGK